MWPFSSSLEEPPLPLEHVDGRSYYEVRPGDSLSRIAQQLGTTVEIMMQANYLQSDVIHPGQKLWVPRTYTLQKGDTLYAISRRYETTVENILKINRIEDPNVILAGDIILLP
eukprot:TRINITY_DN3586_c0_g1_i1.p1 TRINITY_DN3586_c0_g1~~TRINITY_DN3586_c0_g1_i1.p1  ORF type:complete len:113 (-),score=3.18 TRINITY_DN3586_c0_g1_i1:317-655(-)